MESWRGRVARRPSSAGQRFGRARTDAIGFWRAAYGSLPRFRCALCAREGGQPRPLRAGSRKATIFAAPSSQWRTALGALEGGGCAPPAFGPASGARDGFAGIKTGAPDFCLAAFSEPSGEAPDLKTRGKRVRKGRNGGIPPRFARARCHLREVAGLRDLKGGPLDFGPRPKLVLSACQGSRKAWGDRKGGVAIFVG